MSLVKMRSSWICLGSNPMTGYRHTGKMAVGIQAETGVMSTSQRMLRLAGEHQVLGRGGEESPPETSEGTWLC